MGHGSLAEQKAAGGEGYRVRFRTIVEDRRHLSAPHQAHRFRHCDTGNTGRIQKAAKERVEKRGIEPSAKIARLFTCHYDRLADFGRKL